MFRDWRHQVMKCFRWNFVPFFLQTSLKVGNSTGSSLSHFALQNAPHFSIGDRSGLQAGQSSTRTLFLRSQDFVMCAECGFALSCWNMHGRPWKRCLLESSILCSKISMYFSALMVPSQKCKLPLPRALTHPIPWQTLAFGLVAGNSLDDPFLLWSGAHGVHSSQKIPEILIHLTTVHVSTVWWSIPDASEPREVDGASGHC